MNCSVVDFHHEDIPDARAHCAFGRRGIKDIYEMKCVPSGCVIAWRMADM